MENSLWRFANPQLFMRVSGAILPWVAGMAAVGVVLGLVWGFSLRRMIIGKGRASRFSICTCPRR